MNNRHTVALVLANIVLAGAYTAVVLATHDQLSSIMLLISIIALHVLVCCVVGVFMHIRGKREYATGFFISGAVLFASPFVLMIL